MGNGDIQRSVTNFFYLSRDNIGETVIYQWIEKARAWLQDKVAPHDSDQVSEVSETEVQDSKNISEEYWTNFTYQKENDSNISSGPNIIHGDPISFKKSTFQGHVASILSTDQVK